MTLVFVGLARNSKNVAEGIEMKKFIVLGFFIVYAVRETDFFGWNLTPQSPEELICDGIALILCSIFLSMLERKELK